MMSTCTDLVSNCCMKRAYWTLPSSSRGTRSRKASNCSFVSSRLKRLSMAARNSSWLIVSVPRRSIFLQWHEMVTGHHDSMFSSTLIPIAYPKSVLLWTGKVISLEHCKQGQEVSLEHVDHLGLNCTDRWPGPGAAWTVVEPTHQNKITSIN